MKKLRFFGPFLAHMGSKVDLPPEQYALFSVAIKPGKINEDLKTLF